MRRSANIRHEAYGQAAGILIALAALGAATYLAAIGRTTAGVLIFFGDIAAFACILIWGRRASESELARKRQRTDRDVIR